MVYDYILVRFGEMALKGKNKKDFIKRLAHNIKAAFSQYDQLSFNSLHDRLFIELNGVEPTALTGVLSTIFGLSSFSLVVSCPNEITAISATALSLVKDKKGQTFKVKAHRNDKSFPLVSDQINRAVAGLILCETDLKVDVHQPDIILEIEVRHQGTYIMDNRYSGAQGFPVGSSDKALLLLSGGIDSPVAGYLTMKRGVTLQCLHFESSPYTSIAALNKVRDLCKKLSFYQGKVKLHIVPFTKLQLAIYQGAPESYAITLMRRMMLRIAETIAEENKCLALVTGESIGQVASQTLASIKAIEAVICLPVLRPLVSFDKTEIIALAKKIATYDISCLPYEDCCTIFTPKNPTTKPNPAKVLLYEEKLAYNELIEEAINNRQIEIIEFSEK